ncbi:DUF1294 domain-containing protein [Virgibacillus proomii]|uniref:DUF1294 domain-containing protein n=1 Tax=Virgibacillus proomii TaxID=84407 RepID=UPI001C101A69|nr:DUF1294 domain-containing protein [Virgibacillus proomii]MBU5265617.1 DUF1294 domain-containing protein [Virgibacillus proomii]
MGIWSSLLPYLIGVNSITFLLMGIDKQRAKKQQYRIPERTFWLLAVVGGALGVWLGMKIFHHKTKHITFNIGAPALLVVQIGIIGWYLLYSNH